jgi:hypothetical protein
MTTFAASFYGIGNIWMTQFGWRLWPYVAPDDFSAYHNAWWAMIKPVIFPVAAIAVSGSIALIWLRPEGVSAAPVWLNIALQVATYTLTAAFWARWQAQTHYAKLPDGSLDPMYVRAMDTRDFDHLERIGCVLDGDPAPVKQSGKTAVSIAVRGTSSSVPSGDGSCIAVLFSSPVSQYRYSCCLRIPPCRQARPI